MTPMSRKGKWTTEEEALTARIIHYFSLGVLQLPEGTTLRAYLAQKLDCDPMRITKKFTGTNCLGKRVYHSCERTTATYEVAKQAVEELAELEARFRNRLERNKEKRTGIMDIEARLLGNRTLGGVNGVVDTNGLAFTNSSVSTAFQTFGQAAAPGPGPGSMPPNANVAAAAAAAAAAAWNPMSQGYPMPPGYTVTAAHGLYGRPAVSGMLPAGSSAMSAMQGYGMPSIARAPPPAPVGGHPHHLTSAVLHSHQLQLQQFSRAPGVAGVPAPGQVSKAHMAGVTVSRVGQSTAMSMIASQAVTSAAGCSAAIASNVERSIVTPSSGQQLPPAPLSTLPPPQSASSPPSPVGSSSQAYLPSSPGQMHNPYWLYRQNHHPGGGEQGRGDYAEFAPSSRHGYPPSTAQLGSPHLGMTTSMQHHQWIHQHQQRHGGGGAVPPNAGISPSQQQQQQQQSRDHHQQENQQDQEQQQQSRQHLIPPSLNALKLSSAAPNEAVARTAPCSGSGGGSSDGSSDGGSISTASPRVSRTSTASPNSSEAGCEEPAPAPPERGATSADAAAVVSAERPTVSDTMASPRELQQMYHKSKSGRRRHDRNKDEASSTVSISRSNTTGSSSSLGSTTVDGASSRGFFSMSGGSSAGGSRTGSGSDEQQSQINGKDDGAATSAAAAAAGVSSVSSSSGCESGSSSEEHDKQASTVTTDDSQTSAATPRTDVDGAGGLLMGFIESLNKKHKIDQQQQQQQHLHQQHQDHHERLQRQPRGKQPPPQQRPKPPSPHAFPRVRHKHAARMEMEARLASSGAGGNGNFCGAKKMRVSSGADVKPSERSPKTCRGGGRVREAVAPPRLPRSSETVNAGIMLHARPESRKRPRDQQGLVGIVTQQGRREDTDNSEERASSTGDGTSVSSEGGNSEEGGYEEDGDGSSWGSSGRYNDASVSEADYGASDERSSSFEERGDNSDGSMGEAVLATGSRRAHVAVAGEVPQERRRSLLVGPCPV